MSILICCVILVLVLALQLSLGSLTAIFGVTPDLVFAAVTSLAALGNFLSGSLYGMGVGLLMDALFMTPGHYSLQYLLSGLVAGFLPVRGHKHRFLRLLMFCLPAYFAKETVQLFLMRLTGVLMDWPVLLSKVFIGAVYTGLVSILFYLAAETIDRAWKRRSKRAGSKKQL